NSASEEKFPRAVLPGTFDFGFATGLSYKDVRLCIDEAEAMGVPMVCGAAVRQMLAITNAKFGATSDFTSIAKVVEEWAGVQMRGCRLSRSTASDGDRRDGIRDRIACAAHGAVGACCPACRFRP